MKQILILFLALQLFILSVYSAPEQAIMVDRETGAVTAPADIDFSATALTLPSSVLLDSDLTSDDYSIGGDWTFDGGLDFVDFTDLTFHSDPYYTRLTNSDISENSTLYLPEGGGTLLTTSLIESNNFTPTATWDFSGGTITGVPAISIGDSTSAGRALLTAADLTAAQSGVGVFPTTAELRAQIGSASNERALVLLEDRLYRWVADCSLVDSTDAEDIINPTGNVGHGRWVMDWDVPIAEAPLLALPFTTYKMQSPLSRDDDLRVMIIGDSLTAKYHTQPAGESIQQWFFNQVGNSQAYQLDEFRPETAGVPGAIRTPDDDSTESLTGYHHALTAGAIYRVTASGTDKNITSARVYYNREPGAGDFDVTLAAADGAGTVTVNVDADGVRGASYVDIVLPGDVTGSAAGVRCEVTIEVQSGTVKFHPYVDTFDASVDATQLHYNLAYARGGFEFDPEVIGANADVLLQQVVDYAPDLIIHETYDQVDNNRQFVEILQSELTERGWVGDLLLVGTASVFGPNNTDYTSDAIALDGVNVSRRALISNAYRAMAQRHPTVHFYDHASVVRDNKIGTSSGIYPSDDVHPNSLGNGVLAAHLIRSLDAATSSHGPKLFAELVAEDLYVGSLANALLTDRLKSGKFSYVDGDFKIYSNRAHEFYVDGNRVLKVDLAKGTSPGANNTYSLGQSALKWTEVFATNGTVNTSDRREKREIGDIPDAWLDAWAEVEWQRYKWLDGEQSWHVGVIAQDVIAAFARHGIDASEISVVHYDAETDRYGVRYSEASALEGALVRRALLGR